MMMKFLIVTVSDPEYEEEAFVTTIYELQRLAEAFNSDLRLEFFECGDNDGRIVILDAVEH